MSTIATANEKDMEWRSMTAPMDIRSPVDKVEWGLWRYLLNVRAVEQGKLCRRDGWRRFGWQTEHPNSDLHDQHRSENQTIRTLYLHKSHTGIAGSRLFAATKTDIWMNRLDGGWQLAGENLPEGEADTEFASQNNVLIAANSKMVKWQRVGDASFSDLPSGASIGLAGAGGTFQYQGCVFFYDVTMDNARVRHRVIWTGVGNIDLEPSNDSVAGFNDLTPGEQILAAVPLGGIYYLLTTNGAWRLAVSEGNFVFQQQYYSKEGDACLVNKKAVAVTRDVVYFMAKDGIYTLTPYSPSPEWTKDINSSLPIEFIGPENQCVVEAAGYDIERREILFSAPSLGQTFVICPRFGNTSIIDATFTALVCANLDRTQDVAMWWVSSGICTPERVTAFWPPGARDDARVWPEATGTATSCTFFSPPCEECLGTLEMIGASSHDGALKSFNSDFYARETYAGDGEWTQNGYETRMLTGACKFGTTMSKRLTQVLIEFIALPTDRPLAIALTIGSSSTPVDPLSIGTCPVIQLSLSGRELTCGKMKRGLSPNALPARWNPIFEGRFLWFDFKIGPDTGGASCFSRLVTWLARAAGGTP